jgi:hypothetical protein
VTRDAHRGPRRSWRVVLVSTLALGGCGRSADHRAQAVAAFETVRRVLQHPRCLNCHVAGDAPRQLDLGSVHAQSVVRGPDGTGARGLPCSTCHRDANPPASYGTQAPPGAPSWRLPPPGQRMVFEGLSAVELCERLKDPRTNGGKDLAALVDHVRHDPLVRWGWAPGNGRAPVPVPHAELVAAFERWADAEAPCPAWGR